MVLFDIAIRQQALTKGLQNPRRPTQTLNIIGVQNKPIIKDSTRNIVALNPTVIFLVN